MAPQFKTRQVAFRSDPINVGGQPVISAEPCSGQIKTYADAVAVVLSSRRIYDYLPID